MSRDPGRKRKAEERRRKRREREEQKHVRKLEELRSFAGRMAQAGRWPLLGCRIGWIRGDRRKPHVIVAREGPGGITAALWLVDLGCLGLKDCTVREGLTAADYDGLIESVREDLDLEVSSPARTRKLLETAARHARGLGFPTRQDCNAALALLADADPAQCSEEFECGAGGMPFYDPGTEDDVREILRRLEERCGARGFHYLLLPGEVEHDEEFPGEDDPDPEARAWGRLRRAEDWLVAALTKTAYVHFGEHFRERAWEAFAPEWLPEEREALVDGVGGVFDHWALTRTIPGCVPKGRPAREDEERSALAILLEDNAARLPELELRLLVELARRPFSFHVVRAVEPGRSLTLADAFTGEVHTVLERSASRGVVVGTVLFARIVAMDSIAVMMGGAGYVLPPSIRFPLLQVRAHLVEGLGALDDVKLLACEDLQFAHLRQIVHDLRFPPEPVLENTDGEELHFHTLRYDLGCPPEEALAALKELAFEWNDEDFAQEFERDAAGALRKIEFPWQGRGNKQHPSWSNTVLGHLEIEGANLTVEVNSAERAERIQREIERRLGTRATMRALETKTIAQARTEEARRTASSRKDEDEPALHPADATALAERTRATAEGHWKAWFDHPIPALENVSPREAARTPQGRELLDVLLADYAYRGRGPDDPMAANVGALRRELGL